LPGNTVAGYAELKLVALHCPGGRRLESLLDQAALPGFENIALLYEKVKIAGFYAFTKNKIIAPPDNYGKNDQYDQYNDKNGFLFHNSCDGFDK
jgi:hypothetical protein